MKVLLLLGLALVLGACGDSSATTPPTGDAGAPGPSAGALVPRSQPLAAGDVAPAFEGLPGGSRTILVFYRGPW